MLKINNGPEQSYFWWRRQNIPHSFPKKEVCKDVSDIPEKLEIKIKQ